MKPVHNFKFIPGASHFLSVAWRVWLPTSARDVGSYGGFQHDQ